MKDPQILRSGLLSFRADLVALLNKQRVQLEALETPRSKYAFLKEKSEILQTMHIASEASCAVNKRENKSLRRDLTTMRKFAKKSDTGFTKLDVRVRLKDEWAQTHNSKLKAGVQTFRNTLQTRRP